MEPELDPDLQQRSSCLQWMLGFFFVGFFVLILAVATGGYFIYILGVAALLAVVAGMHYALWGRGMDESARREREEAEERDEIIARLTEDEVGGRFRRPSGGD